LLQQLLNPNDCNSPSIWLDVQWNLQTAPVRVLELLVNIAEADLRKPGLVHHIVQVDDTILVVWFVDEQINELSGQS
jgi:hypothetical protein